MNFRPLVRDILPPLVFRHVRRRLHLPGDIRWEGDYADWSSAAAHATGYDDAAILTKVVEATRAVVRGDAVFERDSMLLDKIEYSWPLLGCLLHVAAVRQQLRVLDFGGSLGTTLRQNARFLRPLGRRVQWRVVEQEEFLNVGRREFQDDVLTFHDSVADASQGGVDVALLGGVLGWVESPADVLAQIGTSDAAYLIIDRTLFIEGERDIIAVQRVPASVYRASYPVRKFARQRFTAEVLTGWRVIEEWECHLQPDPSSTALGFFCERAG
jgi:putative methyltransferase (TIGR04325 family)